MSIKDFLNNYVLEGFNTDISTFYIIISLGFSLFLGVYIYFVYKYKSKSSFYSKEFNCVLAGMPVVTGAIVLAMQSSIVISLGMVGALSIVRFRNAVKSSMDLLFLFWAISVGIICGAGLYEVGIILTVMMTILLFTLDFVPNNKKSLLLIINGKEDFKEENLIGLLKKYTKYYKIKSRNINQNRIDLIVELRCKEELAIIEKCVKLKGVMNVNLLTHDGERRF